MTIKTYIKRTPVHAVKVTKDNLEEVTAFCNATVDPNGIYLKYLPNNLDNSAFIPFGYWVVSFGDGYYKGYSDESFNDWFTYAPSLDQPAEEL